VLVLVRLDHAQAASSVGWWNGAVGAARLWAAGPTAQPQHRAYLRGHAAWVTGHVTPAVPERGLAGQGRNVVAPHIPKGTVHRVGCPAIQLDDDTPRAVANVAVPPAPTGSRFTLIPSAAGSPWPCSTSRRYLRSSGEVTPSSTSDSNVEQQGAPSMSRPPLQAEPQSVRGGKAPLRRPEHEIDGLRRRRGVANVDYSFFEPHSWRLRRRMEDRPDVSIIQPATAVHPESRLRQDPS